MNRYILIRRLTGPAILLLLGIIALLHEADLVSWNLFIPLLLILIGVLKLAQRAALAAAGDEPPYPGTYPGAYPGTYPGGGYPGAPNPYAGGANPGAGSPQGAGQQGNAIVPAPPQDFGRGPAGRTVMSTPPYTPPGGAPPPYDPHTQWRVYREQQRAAWRAQRDAWKAQQHAWKAGYGNAYGPRVPSVVGPIILVAIGIVGVLLYSGRIAPGEFWGWYGHWWPLLLIAAGLAMLGEWALDLRRDHAGAPRRRVCGHPDSAGDFGICGIRSGMASGARCARNGATTTTTSSIFSACPSTISTSKC